MDDRRFVLRLLFGRYFRRQTEFEKELDRGFVAFFTSGCGCVLLIIVGLLFGIAIVVKIFTPPDPNAPVNTPRPNANRAPDF